MSILAQSLVHVRTLFRDRITPDQALAAARARLGEREQTFLSTLEAAVFAAADSPYRPLLDAAGYDLARIRRLVVGAGIEGALQRMARDGVYVAVEEFKGRQPAHRGAHLFRFTEQDFRNPLVRSGLQALSGGTRTERIASMISPSNHRMGAEHLVLALAAYGSAHLPAAVWLTRTHGASYWAVLALAARTAGEVHWFTTLAGPSAVGEGAPADQQVIRIWSVLHGIRLPKPRHIPFGEEASLLEIMRHHAPRGYSVFTTASGALRLALAARRTGQDLSVVTFITVAEPLTPGKLGAISAVGARAYSSLGFTEFGRATYGCAFAASADDTHICADAVAVVQRRRPVDQFGTEADALLFTTLRPDARRILLNMETGDYARRTSRRCGCLLEAAGWTTHLEEIRSFEKLNAEGRRFSGTELIALVEETLPARFGGDPTDYQLVEEEDEQGFTRLFVLVHPRLGAIEEDAVLECAQETFRRAHEVGTLVWKEAGTLRVRRAPPLLTAAGKFMPLHHLGRSTPDGVECQPHPDAVGPNR